LKIYFQGFFILYLISIILISQKNFHISDILYITSLDESWGLTTPTHHSSLLKDEIVYWCQWYNSFIFPFISFDIYVWTSVFHFSDIELSQINLSLFKLLIKNFVNIFFLFFISNLSYFQVELKLYKFQSIQLTL